MDDVNQCGGQATPNNLGVLELLVPAANQDYGSQHVGWLIVFQTVTGAMVATVQVGPPRGTHGACG